MCSIIVLSKLTQIILFILHSYDHFVVAVDVSSSYYNCHGDQVCRV